MTTAYDLLSGKIQPLECPLTIKKSDKGESNLVSKVFSLKQENSIEYTLSKKQLTKKRRPTTLEQNSGDLKNKIMSTYGLYPTSFDAGKFERKLKIKAAYLKY
ncbi:hypothetical protein M0812_16611 [Anaeramoeba flamelloides]|uniref:Uncharacterized protein n=1 Tax=Anaeramoeba flamelloides TaxID=1746091 RepID=A0AAV7ZB82_9EUKA|nr:hypothetical protein M0812_16611 [Anaeramoeba flamelloides]